MSDIELTGDWNKVSAHGIKEAETAIGMATDEVGRYIVETLKRHFDAQDLGWAPLSTKTLDSKTHANKAKLSKASRKELRTRASFLGVSGYQTMTKKDLISNLSSKTQILIDTGLLSRSFTYKRLTFNSGQVGVMRMSTGGANIAAIHEYGAPSKNIPARPFIKPVAEEVSPKIASIYQKYIDGVEII